MKTGTQGDAFAARPLRVMDEAEVIADVAAAEFTLEAALLLTQGAGMDGAQPSTPTG